MDNQRTRDRTVLATANDESLLKSRIIETCKHLDTDFTADTERIRQNVNMIFNANYSSEEVSRVVGVIYEEQFYYREL